MNCCLPMTRGNAEQLQGWNPKSHRSGKQKRYKPQHAYQREQDRGNDSWQKSRKSGYQHWRNRVEANSGVQTVRQPFYSKWETWQRDRDTLSESKCSQLSASPLLQHPKIPMDTKAKLINTIFLPTLTYKCQKWALTITKSWRER